MRRDICHFYPADVKTVYNGYLAVLGNDKFDRECHQEPYHTLGFGLNFSMKYNFNGGGCNIHFMPYNNGTAVDLRFTLAQLAGARYEKYDRDLTDGVQKELGIFASDIRIDVEEFLKPQNQITPERFTETPSTCSNQQTDCCAGSPVNEYQPPVVVAPTPQPEIVPQPAPQPVIVRQPVPQPEATQQSAPVGRFCSGCGNPVGLNDLFCGKCGTRQPRFCSNCGSPAGEGNNFCTICGTKL